MRSPRLVRKVLSSVGGSASMADIRVVTSEVVGQNCAAGSAVRNLQTVTAGSVTTGCTGERLTERMD